MEGGPPVFRQDGSCPALLKDLVAGFPYGAVTRYGPPFQTLPVPNHKTTGLVRVRSPLLTESRLMSFPPATEMFQFTGFASRAYGFSAGYPLRGGLPHSEIPGSTIARISPGLFAACHVLHRLSVPRHPPDALVIVRSTMSFSRPGPRPALAGAHGPFLRPALAGTPKNPSPPLRANPKDIPENRRAQGQAPIGGQTPIGTRPAGSRPRHGARMKTLLPNGSARRLACAPRPVRLGHIHKFASPVNQHPPPNPRPPARTLVRPAAPVPGTKPGLLRMPFGTSELRGQNSEVRTQRSELRGQNSEVRTQRSELRGQNPEVRTQRSGRRPAVPAVEMPEWR